jgi:HEAT repeat protein
VRAEAAGLLANVAPAHAAANAPLISALADNEAQVRQAAADSLGQIGEPARPALQPLWRLIHDPDEAVRESAVRAIHRIRD